MACSIAEQNEIKKEVVKVFIRDLKKSNPKASGTEIRAAAKEQASALFEEATPTKPLGSSVDSMSKDWNTSDEVREKVNKSIEGMKDLMVELHELGGGKESDEHLEYLKSLFGDMDESFFNKITVYLSKDAEASDGIVINNNVGIKVKEGKKDFDSQMSDAEIYTHEIIHSMTMFALRSDNRKAEIAKRELEYVIDKAQKALKWEDFLPENSIDKEAEEKVAKDLYEYIFFSENSPEEFLAYALTNPIVMEQLKNIAIQEKEENTTVWEKLRELFTTFMNILSGDFSFKHRGNNAYEQAYALAFDLAEVNNQAVAARNNKISLANKLWDGLQKYNTSLAETLEDYWKKYVDGGEYKAPPPPKETGKRAMWMAGMVIKMLTNNNYRKAFELILSGFGLDPRGDTQTILRDFFRQDDLAQDVDMLALLSDKIDTAKNAMVNATVKLAHSAFNKELTTVEEEAITAVILDTDISSIAGKFDSKTLSKLLNHPEEINRRISRAKHQLQKFDDANYDWNVSQAEGLGYLMATGKGHIAQNINAENIITGKLSPDTRKTNKKAVALVDEIATLVALRNTPKETRAVVANLMKDNRKGVENIIKMHDNFKERSAEKVFGNSKINMVKGYTKELFDDQVSILIAPVGKEKELLKEGYKKKYNLKQSEHIKGKQEDLAVYVADSFETTEIYRTATRMTAIKSRGTSVKAAVYEDDSLSEEQKKKKATENFEDIHEAAFDLAYEISQGNVKLEDIQTGMMPVLNEDGIVTDYRYMMPKDTKKELLVQNTKMSEVLAKSNASILDKQDSYEQNEKVLDMLLDDMQQNYISGTKIGSNNKEYILISANSTDPEVQDLYSRLPKLFKDNIKLLDGQELAVRADLFHNYFGYRHISITDNKLLKLITPQVMRKLIKVAEQMWMEFIKITKVDILLKMPVVIVGNLISNFMYGVMTGTNPVELIKMYMESSRNVVSYFKDHTELTDLQLAKETGNVNNLDLGRIPMLERRLTASSVHELAELGIYQSIVEDIDTRELESTNKLKRAIDRKAKEHLPEVVRQGINTLYLTQDTRYYKVMNEILTKSDLIARDIENKKIKATHVKQMKGELALPRWFVMRNVDKIKGAKYTKTTKRLSGKELKEFKQMADDKRHAQVLDAFVNYNKPSGRMEEYLNRIGAIMFTKYFKRIQRVISTTSLKHPLNVMGVILGEEFLGDVETIYDQNILTKNWYNFGISNDDMIPGTNPFDRIMEVINPPLVQLLRDPQVF